MGRRVDLFVGDLTGTCTRVPVFTLDRCTDGPSVYFRRVQRHDGEASSQGLKPARRARLAGQGYAGWRGEDNGAPVYPPENVDRK